MKTIRLTDEQRLLAEKYLPLWQMRANATYRLWPYLYQEMKSELALALIQVCSSHDPNQGVKLATRYHERADGAIRDVLRRQSPRGYQQRVPRGKARPVILRFSPVKFDARFSWRPV